jgi:hypothetical protein
MQHPVHPVLQRSPTRPSSMLQKGCMLWTLFAASLYEYLRTVCRVPADPLLHEGRALFASSRASVRHSGAGQVGCRQRCAASTGAAMAWRGDGVLEDPNDSPEGGLTDKEQIFIIVRASLTAHAAPRHNPTSSCPPSAPLTHTHTCAVTRTRSSTGAIKASVLHTRMATACHGCTRTCAQLLRWRSERHCVPRPVSQVCPTPCALAQ